MRVLVSGASRGIGLEITRALAEQGHSVLALTRSGVPVLPEIPQVQTLFADISDIATDYAALAEECSRTGSFDAVVNNAGALLNAPFDTMDATSIQYLFEANVFGPMRLLKALKPHLNRPAHILNIGSMGGVQGSAKFPGLAWYSAGKGALAVLIECLAEEWKEEQIRVNCLALGAVQTEMLQAAFPGYNAPLTAAEMGSFIADFVQNGARFFNGKILPVSVSTP